MLLTDSLFILKIHVLFYIPNPSIQTISKHVVIVVKAYLR